VKRAPGSQQRKAHQHQRGGDEDRRRDRDEHQAAQRRQHQKDAQRPLPPPVFHPPGRQRIAGQLRQRQQHQEAVTADKAKALGRQLARQPDKDPVIGQRDKEPHRQHRQRGARKPGREDAASGGGGGGGQDQPRTLGQRGGAIG